LALAVLAKSDIKIISMKFGGTVTWSNARKRYNFFNTNHIQEDIFVFQTVITVYFDFAKVENCTERWEMLVSLVELLFKVVMCSGP
jgi:hypothetical protein